MVALTKIRVTAQIRRYPKSFARGLAALLLVLAQIQAGHADDTDKLPIPRFVSMKHGFVNLRVGPGKRYPVEWILERKGMPVEIIGTFDTWRRIRDWQGDEGWVIEQAVGSDRGFVVTGEIRALHAEADPNANLVARLEPGVMGKLISCPTDSPDWCEVEASGIRGWIQRDEIWGVLPGEVVQ